MLLDTLMVKVTGDSSGLSSAMKSAESAIRGFESSAQKGGNTLTRWGSSMVSGLGTTFKAAGVIAAGTVVGVVATATSSIMNAMDAGIKRTDIINNFPRVMSNFGIGTGDAQAAIDKLSDSLKGLPTGLDQAAAGVQRLVSKNGDINKSTDMYLAMNNAILAGGASMELQKTATEQLTQAYSKGKFDIQEWRSLQMAMPGQLNQVAQAFGHTQDSLYEALSSGEISMDQFMEKIMELNETGTDEFLSFAEQAKNATGGISTSLANVQNALSRGWEKIFNAIGSERIQMLTGQLISIIDKAATAMVPFFERVGDVIEKVFGEGGSLGSAKESAGQFSGAITTLIPVVGALLGAFGGLLSGVPVVGQIFSGMNPVFGATVGVFIAMVKESDILRNALGNMFTVIMPVLQAVGNLAQQIMTALTPVFGALGDALGIVLDALTPIFPIITGLINKLAGMLVPVLSQVIAAVVPVITTVAEFAAQLLGGLIPAISNVIYAVMPLIETFLSLLIPMFESVINAVMPVIEILMDALIPVFTEVIAIVAEVVASLMPVVEAIIGAVMPAITSLIDAIAPLIAQIAGALVPIFQTAAQIIRSIVGAIMPVVVAIADALVPILTALISIVMSVVEAIMPVVEVLVGLLGPAFEFVGNVITGVLDFIMPLIEGALSVVVGVAEGIAAAVEWVAGFVTPILEGIGGFFESIFGKVEEDVSSSMDGVTNTVQSAGESISSTTSSSLSQVDSTWSSTLKSVSNNTSSWGSTQRSTFSSTMSGANSTVSTGMSKMNSNFVSKLNNMTNTSATTGSTINSNWNSSMSGINSTTTSGMSQVNSQINSQMNSMTNTMRTGATNQQQVWTQSWTEIQQVVSQGMTQVTNKVNQGINSIMNTLNQFKSNITSAFSNAGSLLVSAGANLMNGLLIGIQSRSGSVLAYVRYLCNQIRAEVERAMDIRSPSGVMMSLGEFITKGLAVGIESMAGTVVAATDDIMTDLVDAVESFSTAQLSPIEIPVTGVVDKIANIAAVDVPINNSADDMNRSDSDSGDTIIIEAIYVSKEDLDSGDLPADIKDILRKQRAGVVMV